MNESREQLAKNLKRLMTRFKLNVPALSKRVKNVSTKTLGNLCNAEGHCTLSTLDEVADAFGVQSWMLLAPQPYLADARHPDSARIAPPNPHDFNRAVIETPKKLVGVTVAYRLTPPSGD